MTVNGSLSHRRAGGKCSRSVRDVHKCRPSLVNCHALFTAASGARETGEHKRACVSLPKREPHHVFRGRTSGDHPTSYSGANHTPVSTSVTTEGVAFDTLFFRLVRSLLLVSLGVIGLRNMFSLAKPTEPLWCGKLEWVDVVSLVALMCISQRKITETVSHTRVCRLGLPDFQHWITLENNSRFPNFTPSLEVRFTVKVKAVLVASLCVRWKLVFEDNVLAAQVKEKVAGPNIAALVSNIRRQTSVEVKFVLHLLRTFFFWEREEEFGPVK